MNHCGTLPLETKRLILRRFELSDAPAFYRNVCSDPKVNTYLTWKLHESPAETEALLEDFIRRYENPARYCWAIVLKETDDVIGTIAAPTVHELTECVEVTYAIGSAWWGKGCVPEALAAVMDFLFDRVGVNRIEAGHDIRNPNSGKVMEKVGMRKEGIHRQAGRNNQGLFDLVFYAKLRQDRV